jgi:hypothetical protein
MVPIWQPGAISTSAVGAGILVLIRPQLLNFAVAACLILTGVVGLNGLYHFVR